MTTSANFFWQITFDSLPSFEEFPQSEPTHTKGWGEKKYFRCTMILSGFDAEKSMMKNLKPNSQQCDQWS